MEDRPHDRYPLSLLEKKVITIEKINYEGITLETKKEYKTGKSELLAYWPNGNPKEANLKYTEGTYKTWYEEWPTWKSQAPTRMANHKVYTKYGIRMANLKPHGTYENGRLQGLYQSWYENGTQKKLETYELGNHEGPHKEWHSNGQLALESFYVEDKYEGEYKEWYKERTTACEDCL